MADVVFAGIPRDYTSAFCELMHGEGHRARPAENSQGELLLEMARLNMDAGTRVDRTLFRAYRYHVYLRLDDNYGTYFSSRCVYSDGGVMIRAASNDLCVYLQMRDVLRRLLLTAMAQTTQQLR